MAEHEQTESPWDQSSPHYRAVPQINPKTAEPVKIYACMVCGSSVISRKIHSEWHRKLRSAGSWPPF